MTTLYIARYNTKNGPDLSGPPRSGPIQLVRNRDDDLEGHRGFVAEGVLRRARDRG